MNINNIPLIVGFVSNLFFSTKIETQANVHGFKVIWIENADYFGPPEIDKELLTRQMAEHLVGRGALLLDKITSWHPALLIFDLGNSAVPWRHWLSLIKSVPATRRIPTICFGSHVDVETIQEAKERGADAFYARSKFFNDIGKIILKHAVLPDFKAINKSCRGQLSPKAIEGLQMFNQGRYYEAHEELEEAWNADETVGRELYRAILQIAVAYLQIERKNFNGAQKMFLRVRQWIDPLPDFCRGVNIAKLRQDANYVQKKLIELGPEKIDEFDITLLKKVEFQL